MFIIYIIKYKDRGLYFYKNQKYRRLEIEKNSVQNLQKRALFAKVFPDMS